MQNSTITGLTAQLLCNMWRGKGGKLSFLHVQEEYGREKEKGKCLSDCWWSWTILIKPFCCKLLPSFLKLLESLRSLSSTPIFISCPLSLKEQKKTCLFLFSSSAHSVLFLHLFSSLLLPVLMIASLHRERQWWQWVPIVIFRSN